MIESAVSGFLPYVILIPSLFAVLVLLIPSRKKAAYVVLSLAGTAANLAACALIYGKNAVFNLPWCGFGIDFSLRNYFFSSFILLGAAVFAFCTVLYCTAFLKEKPYAKRFFAYLLFTMTLVNGAVLANNLVVLLFFWEGILVTIFAMILLGGAKSWRTSVKSLVIVGLSDLCMMLGIGIAGHLAGTFTMDKISLPLTNSLEIAAFVLMAIGAVAKAGAMPFHTWIPDAAEDAPMPFMALLPGALEKLLGIYLLARLCINLFQLEPGSSMSLMLMIVGAATILFAVMMALVQKDYKRLLSYHAVSQVGYMILGIGTALPVGIVGGLFHMINHAVYKSCLFLTSGSVELQAGTTDLRKLGGLSRKMPVTFGCFVVAAAAIAGFPMTNGFFSKELVFDGALESGAIFYIIAVAGAFFTAVSFLKLGHAVFMGQRPKELNTVKEAPLPMLLPMVFLAALCLALGFSQSFVIGTLMQPVLGAKAPAEIIGSHANWALIGISVAVLALALLDHYLGFKKEGSGVRAADHFHHAPILRSIYDMAEKKYFDPYQAGRIMMRGFASLSLRINDGISWFYDVFLVRLFSLLSAGIRRIHNGSQTRYLGWILVGIAAVAAVFILSL